jgi:hypothetical protein
MEAAKYEDNMTFKSVYFASHTTKKEIISNKLRAATEIKNTKKIVEQRARYFWETKQLQEYL